MLKRPDVPLLMSFIGISCVNRWTKKGALSSHKSIAKKNVLTPFLVRTLPIIVFEDRQTDGHHNGSYNGRLMKCEKISKEATLKILLRREFAFRLRKTNEAKCVKVDAFKSSRVLNCSSLLLSRHL